METLTENKKNVNKEISRGYQDIIGWGIDADPKNDPTYPMKHNTGADYQRLIYERVEQQPLKVEILQSNERPSVTRVFGTSTPPSGLSGKLRRYAFKYSEGNAVHWLTLLLADRINVVEGVIDDFRQGIVPNIFVENGWRAEWRYNPKGAIKKVAIGVAVTSAVLALMIYRNKNKKLTRPK